MGGSTAEAIRIMDRALARDPLATIPVPDRPYAPLINEYAFLGDAARARQLYKEMIAADTLRSGRGTNSLGWVEIAEGKYDAGLARLRSTIDSSACYNCARYYLAWAYDRAGQHDSTRVILEQIVNASPEWEQYFEDALNRPRAFKRLGELYEEKGDRAKALEYYGRLLEIWRDADAPLQPMVKEVRSRVAKLAAEERAPPVTR